MLSPLCGKMVNSLDYPITFETYKLITIVPYADSYFFGGVRDSENDLLNINYPLNSDVLCTPSAYIYALESEFGETELVMIFLCGKRFDY
jgi:hypothetical protein